ncbi:filamentous hemagglutinin N-terminal domain-containing protein [Massilia sp. LMS1-1-1.1]
MNRIHRTVWNHRRNAVMVVAENAGSGGKRSGTTGALLASVLTGVMLGGAAQAADLAATALPSGAVVTAGQAHIGQSGAAMTVTQATGKAAIEWTSFSIGKDAKVNFVQPNAASVTLNRIKGNEGSVIDGALKANGQVFILNPNGVLFGKGARVDTAGLVASTLNLGDADFLAGKTSFSGKGGAVTNLGSLNANDGGYIALLGAQVRNEGVISARLGTVALAAGNKVSLTFDGGALVGVAIDEAALAALVANGNAVHADGGLVVLTAKGADGLLNTVVNNTGEVRARTIQEQAGRIFLLGEGGAVEVAGKLDASAPQGGNGGFIETSGPVLRVADGTRVDTGAAAGRSGSWLIDPIDFTIGSGSAAQGASGIGVDTLQTALAAGNVTIQTQTGGSEAGDIHVNAPLAWNANQLTLEAHGDIHVNAIMSATGSSTLDMKTGYNFNPGSPTFNIAKNVLVGIDDAGVFKGRIDFDRAGTGLLAINGVGYTLINALGNAGSTTSLDLQGINGGGSGRYALASNIDASATSGWNTGAGFVPLSLSGTFDGLGHTVSGLRINQPSGSYVGLFGTNNGTVRNVAMSNAVVYANQGVGALAGLSMGRVYNSYAAGTVTGPGGYVGGLIGAIFDGTASRVHFDGTVNSQGNNVGGLTGYLAYQITVVNSYANATVTNTAGVWTGGLVGQNDYGYIVDSHASGTITGKGDTGGLAGNNNSGRITGSYSTANVTGTTNTGGLVGNNNNGKVSGSYASGAVTGTSTVGGLIGLSSASGGVATPDNEINTSYASGAVTATGDNAGGLIGRNYGNHVVNTYARGAVSTSGNYVGGLIGNNLGTADKSYSTGPVTSPGVGVGGLMGVSIGGVSNSFWDTQTSGQNSSGDGTGKTTAQMQDSNLFTTNSWDFTFHSGVWGRKATLNDGYPVLRTFGYTDPITITLNDPALTRSYGGANPLLAGGWTVSGCDNNLACVSGIDWSAALLPTTSVGTFNYGAGLFAPTLGAGYGKLSDYDITYSTGTLSITPAVLSIAGIGAANKTYDRTNVASINAGTLVGLVNGENLSLSASGSFDSANAGARTVAATVLVGDGSGANAGQASNYILSTPTVNLAATISALEVHLASLGGREYDATDKLNANLLQITNVLAGDTVNLSGTGTLASRNAGTQALAGYADLMLDNANYTFAPASLGTNVLVTPRALSVNAANGATRRYDGSVNAATGLLSLGGVLAGDSASLSGSAILAGKNVGAQAISGLGTLSLDNANYTLNGVVPAGSVAITALPINVAAVTNASRDFDSTADAAAGLLELRGVLAGDSATLGGKATLSSRDAGDRSIVDVSGLTLSNSNYTLAGGSASGTVKILPVTPVTPVTPEVPVTPEAPKANLANTIAEVSRTSVPAKHEVLRDAGLALQSDLMPFVAVPPTVNSSALPSAATFGANAPLSLLYSPGAGEMSEGVTLAQTQRLLQASGAQGNGGSQPLRLPVSRNSLMEIVNGGVKLPDGVDQLLFVVKAQ